VVFNIPNEHINVQDQSRNQNAGEGSSQIYSHNVVNDNEGHEIDLNKPYCYFEDYDENQC